MSTSRNCLEDSPAVFSHAVKISRLHSRGCFDFGSPLPSPHLAASTSACVKWFWWRTRDGETRLTCCARTKGYPRRVNKELPVQLGLDRIMIQIMMSTWRFYPLVANVAYIFVPFVYLRSLNNFCIPLSRLHITSSNANNTRKSTTPYQTQPLGPPHVPLTMLL
jgi:hypothetical protein